MVLSRQSNRDAMVVLGRLSRIPSITLRYRVRGDCGGGEAEWAARRGPDPVHGD